MKIINNTTGNLQYFVTPSGMNFSISDVIASGTIQANSANEFDATLAGTGPNVYFKVDSTSGPGMAFRKAANPASVLKVDITEE
jgi:hypothetical protein